MPGVYEGSQSGFFERVDLRTNGSFIHEASYGGRSLVKEVGKWSFDVHSGGVYLEPFTSIWKGQGLSTNLVHWDVGCLFVERYGRAAHIMSPSVNFKYELFKKSTRAAALKEQLNNLPESNRRPGSPLDAGKQFGRAVDARTCMLGGGRSANR